MQQLRGIREATDGDHLGDGEQLLPIKASGADLSDCEASRASKASGNDRPDDIATGVFSKRPECSAPFPLGVSEVGDCENSSSSSFDYGPSASELPAAWSMSSRPGAQAAKAKAASTFEMKALQVEHFPLQRLDERTMQMTRMAASVSKQARTRARREVAVTHDQSYLCFLCGMHHELKDKRLMHGRTGIMYLPAGVD